MFRNVSKLAPIIFTALATGINSNPAQAQGKTNDLMQQIEAYGQEKNGRSMGQVTNVNQLKDVSPTDWAYEALRSLVDRYGCIAGFPNQTYRGDQPLTRYEFAAGLNSCLNQIERLIASQESVGQEDIEAIQRLSQEFEAELAAVSGRIDELESRTALVEDNQFSTTTKLAGEVILSIAGVATGSTNDGEDDIDNVPVFFDRVRLELETSFTGEDLLFTRLSTGNFAGFAGETGTFEGELGFAEDADNDVGLEVLFYQFGVGDNTDIFIGPAGLASDDFASTVNALDGDGGAGAISLFGTRNPIFFLNEGAGLGVAHRLGDILEISAGYLASDAAVPEGGSGLFNGPFSALGQILFTPTDNFSVAATYIHAFNQSDTETGSSLANFQSFTEDLFGEAVPTVSDSYGLQFSWEISDRFIVGGWGAFSSVSTLDTLDGQVEGGSQEIVNWAATLAVPDFLTEGSMAGIIVGMEPFVADSSIETPGIGDDEDTSVHVEAFYEYRINDNIAVTPGIIWATAPDSNDDNDDLVIGAIRTTFNF
ncbi:MAG: iron uptake porin [Cyanobacteria bacterium P01_G01_bin.39]